MTTPTPASVTLKITDPKPDSNPRNTYQLRIEYMHGDADAYTDKTRNFSGNGDQDSLKIALLFLNAAASYDFDDRAGSEEQATYLAEVTGLSFEQAEEFLDNFTEGDCTCDFQYQAAFDGYEVVYFDERGVEHDVEVGFL